MRIKIYIYTSSLEAYRTRSKKSMGFRSSTSLLGVKKKGGVHREEEIRSKHHLIAAGFDEEKRKKKEIPNAHGFEGGGIGASRRINPASVVAAGRELHAASSRDPGRRRGKSKKLHKEVGATIACKPEGGEEEEEFSIRLEKRGMIEKAAALHMVAGSGGEGEEVPPEHPGRGRRSVKGGPHHHL